MKGLSLETVKVAGGIRFSFPSRFPAESSNVFGGVKARDGILPLARNCTSSSHQSSRPGISHRKMAQCRIGLIICSTRVPQVGPSIASWIASLLTPDILNGTTIEVLDLAAYPLPNSPPGPRVPLSQPLPLTPDTYPSAEINIWSADVNSCAGFIFLTPQYNWSFPGSVKIAIDHLYHEWTKKPALIVSYGGRGGGKANEALRQVLKGVRCNAWEGKVELAIGGGKGMEFAEKGVWDEGVREMWISSGKGEEIVERYRELVGLIAPPVE